MGRFCARCGRPLKLFSYYTEDGLCYTCEVAARQGKHAGNANAPAQIMTVVNQIANTKSVSDTQVVYLKELDHFQRSTAYAALVDRLKTNGKMDDKEILLLDTLLKDLGLDPDEYKLIDDVTGYD